MKHFNLIILLLLTISLTAQAQLAKDASLHIEFKKQDSIFFQRGFNECDIEYLKNHISDDLKFYHDQSGFQDKSQFLENTQKYICSNSGKKPIRRVNQNSLEVFPLYNNGKIYGVIQNGTHDFYLKEKGQPDLWTSTAKFTHVWILDNKTWKINEVLSYDHKDSRSESP